MNSSSPTKSMARASRKRRHASPDIGIAVAGPSGSAPGQRSKHTRATAVKRAKSTTKADTKKTKSIQSSPPNDSAPSHMFVSDNITVSGGQFTIAQNVNHNVNNGQAEAFKLLQGRVASSAFHNSAQRVDPPRCHPDTRVDILQRIFDWIVESKYRKEWLMWLNGAAGAGKSAIIQSMAERCVQNAIAIAGFFFFRSDPTRNSMAPLIATLAYQLTQVIPETLDDILLIIERNPLIFDQSLESQLQHLIIQPLLRLPRNLQRLFVVFIDGLDECTDRDHQSSLISLLGKLSSAKNIPVVFVVASRREPQIEAAFKRKQVSNLVQVLPLDNSDIEQTSEDIQHFLTDKFNEIKETHLRKHLLSFDWPPSSSIDQIVAKSSGQFIYASVVVKFVSSPHSHPALQLDVIKGIRPRSHSENPFAHLDALYQYIFSQVKEYDLVRNVLAFRLMPKQRLLEWLNEIEVLEVLFQLASGELEVSFTNLTAVIECEPYTKDEATMKFLHASLPDFLLDKSRSEEYYIDLTEYHTKLLCMFLERPPQILDPLSPTRNLEVISEQEYQRLGAIWLLLEKAKASDQIQKACMSFNFAFHSIKMANTNSFYFPEVLDCWKRLDFNNQGKVYHHVVEVFAVEYAKYWPSIDDYRKSRVSEAPDLLARISQIRQEEL